MTYDPHKHHRRSIRLPGYDYTQAGAYFVTFVAHDRECLFGDVVDGVMRLNAFGEIVREEWFRTAVVRPYVMLDPDEFVVMPNHVHGIIWIVRSGDGDHGDDGGGVFAGAHGGDASVGAHLLVGAQRRCAPTNTNTNTNANAITDAVNITEHRQCRGATPTNVIPGSWGPSSARAGGGQTHRRSWGAMMTNTSSGMKRR
jgi:hypothetical protein